VTARIVDRAVLVTGFYLAAFWLWAGLAKAIAPEAAYDFSARVFGGGLPAKSIVLVSVVAETLLGAALLLRVLRPRRGVLISFGLLLAFTAMLLVARASGGGALACGCYAFFATSAASVDRELWINVAHAAILGALLLAAAFARPRSAG